MKFELKSDLYFASNLVVHLIRHKKPLSWAIQQAAKYYKINEKSLWDQVK